MYFCVKKIWNEEKMQAEIRFDPLGIDLIKKFSL